MLLKEKIFGHFYKFVFMLVAVICIVKTTRDLSYYFDKAVIAVNTSGNIDKLHDNALAEIALELDFAQAYKVSYLSGREFLLIPFSGLGYKLMYAVEGPLTDKFMASLHPPYKGRVVEKDFADSWEVYDQSMKLKSLFARDHLSLPANAMLIYDVPKELPTTWEFFLFGLSGVYLLYQAYSFTRIFRADDSVSGTTPEAKVQKS